MEAIGTDVGCPSCGTRATAKDRRETWRDLPAAGRPVVLVWRKRRWSCPEHDCEDGPSTPTGGSDQEEHGLICDRGFRWASNSTFGGP